MVNHTSKNHSILTGLTNGKLIAQETKSCLEKFFFCSFYLLEQIMG